MIDQAFQLRHLKRQAALEEQCCEPAPYVVTLLGCKGGVGTTTLSVCLARELARCGHSVVLTALGTRVDDLATMTGVTELTKQPAGHRLPWRDSVSLLGTCANQENRDLTGYIRHVHEDEVLLTDSGSWNGAALQHPAPQDVIFLVTTDDSLAMIDTYAYIKQLVEAWGDDISERLCVVVNRATEFSGEAAERLLLTCQRFLGLDLRTPLLVKLSDEIPTVIDAKMADGPAIEGLVGLLNASMESDASHDVAVLSYESI